MMVSCRLIFEVVFCIDEPEQHVGGQACVGEMAVTTLDYAKRNSGHLTATWGKFKVRYLPSQEK
jgi:hypothetical protein